MIIQTEKIGIGTPGLLIHRAIIGGFEVASGWLSGGVGKVNIAGTGHSVAAAREYAEAILALCDEIEKEEQCNSKD